MKLNCFILRTTAVAGLGVPIFRVITVMPFFFTFLQNFMSSNFMADRCETVTRCEQLNNCEV